MSQSRQVHLRIRGRVQGVFYRQSAKAQADRLGVGGWVRNLEDGDVEAAAEGPAEAVKAWVDWCHRGPPGARVDEVIVTEGTPTGQLAVFEVRHP
jgi:acylphosphatase